MVIRKKYSYYWKRKCKQFFLVTILIFFIGFIGHQQYLNKSLSNNANEENKEEASAEEEIRQDYYHHQQKVNPESDPLNKRQQHVRSAIDIVESAMSQLDSFISVNEVKKQQFQLVKQSMSKDAKQAAKKMNTLDDSNNEAFRSERCNMNNCFNFSKCATNNFKVFVYPVDALSAAPSSSISSTYQKILNSIGSSPYYTADPLQACIFVLSIDTLDRDELSRDYLRNMESRLSQLELWNNGENHVIFNLYAGTWPNYNETELGFNIGKAILAQASISTEQYRPNFDISFPLFHGTHSEKGEEEGGIGNGGGQGQQQQLHIGVSTNFPDLKKHLISFKGKRYVYGIGSETRNSIYHLHNRKDVIMVTTCKHGKNWKEMKDERCDQDNIEYEKYDYESLLQNSTFCLVPRGRRLGSFRFLEVLHAGCIPVILSNGWVLPFSEVIDWSQAAIVIDERNLLQTLEIVRSVSHKRIFQLKQQTQILWNQYLSSVKKIIDTTLEILRDRIHHYNWRDSSIWNSAAGGLAYDLDFADDINRFPFGTSLTFLRKNFTAVIYVHAPGNTDTNLGKNGLPTNHYTSNTHLLRLVRIIGKSSYVSKILIVWDSTRPIPKTWPELSIPLTIKRSSVKSVMQRFVSTDEIETDAIFSLDEYTIITTDEIDFAYQVWSSFPDRIVGYSTRSYYWDDFNETWRYSSKWTNDYSLVLNGGSMYHVYYNYVFNTKLPPHVQYLMGSLLNDCEDIVLNILIGQLNHSPPIKLIWRKMDVNTRSQWNSDHLKRQQDCLNELYNFYGTFPLKRSIVRFDPILYKDPVSNMRKKYRQVELL